MSPDPTPNGTRVLARASDGTETDVTDGVQALYDHCVSSLDWGSGFLSVEDAAGIIRIAQSCGFLMPESAASAFADYAQAFADDRNQSNIICAVCGEQVWYSTGYGDPERSPRGWHHVDHEPGHAPQLWR